MRYLREPVLLGFSTASSEAAYPRTLEALELFGVPPRIASFVLGRYGAALRRPVQ